MKSSGIFPQLFRRFEWVMHEWVKFSWFEIRSETMWESFTPSCVNNFAFLFVIEFLHSLFQVVFISLFIRMIRSFHDQAQVSFINAPSSNYIITICVNSKGALHNPHDHSILCYGAITEVKVRVIWVVQLWWCVV